MKKKQQLSEQFLRMQKLAGIKPTLISENVEVTPPNNIILKADFNWENTDKSLKSKFARTIANLIYELDKGGSKNFTIKDAFSPDIYDGNDEDLFIDIDGALKYFQKLPENFIIDSNIEGDESITGYSMKYQITKTGNDTFTAKDIS